MKMAIADKILGFYKKLQPPKNLPKTVEVLNPYLLSSSWGLTKQFYQKYYSDANPRTILFGINPGRFGGGITGVPFTDPHKLETFCGIPNDFDKKQELSSKFIYEMIMAFGGPDRFYANYYISAVSPLGFVENNKNLNYYDIPNWKMLFEDYAVQMIRDQFSFPVNRNIAYAIGQGQNMKFLQEINKKHQLFKEIIPLPHPRWVMQYRLKRKQEFVDEYLNKLQISK